MKKNLLFLFCITVILLTGCSKDNDEASGKGESNGKIANPEVKKWIREKMDTYYLWNDKIPAESSITGTLPIEDYFEGLLYRANKSVNRINDTYGDRFSHINKLSTTTRSQQILEKNLGGRLIVINYESSKMMVQFMYVSPDSPLAAEGKIKRGTIFNKVNGVQLTESNYESLLSKPSMTISNDTKYGDPLTATTINEMSYPGTPILYHNVLNISNHKIGYLVYNEFKRGPDENDFYNTEFEEDLKTIFQSFKDQNIDKLVLDLRYNPGGYLVTAQLLASLIAPEAALGKVLAYQKYNSKIEKNPALLQEMGGKVNYFLTKQNVPNNINMHSICIITTQNTASASEFVLNCLKPYMTVIQVGETTTGKNQSALAFKREPNHDWEISPIISYVENSNHVGNYEAGIEPNFESHDYKMIYKDGEWYINDVRLYEFGDYVREPMLNEALKRLGINVPNINTTVRSASTNNLGLPLRKIIKPQIQDKGLIKVLQ